MDFLSIQGVAIQKFLELGNLAWGHSQDMLKASCLMLSVNKGICCERWSLSHRGSVAEHWQLKPAMSWVRLPATAGLFTFLYLRLITSKLYVESIWNLRSDTKCRLFIVCATSMMTVYCSLVPQKDATPPKFAGKKLLQIDTKPQNLQSFLPGKIPAVWYATGTRNYFVTRTFLKSKHMVCKYIHYL